MRYLSIFLFVMAAACNNANNSSAINIADSTPATTVVNQKDTVCYLAVQNRDSILLQLYLHDSTVTGRMQYDNFEMDGNIGTVQATQRQNRIEGYFRYFAEGMWSVREIVFEVAGDQLRQAQTANMVYSGDTAQFQNKAKVLFDQRVFKKQDCGVLHFGKLPQ